MRGVVTDTGGVTATVYIGNYYEQTGGASRLYYYLGGKRVAMRDEAGALYFLLGDHLGSTSVAYRADDGETTTRRYSAWGAVRPGPANELPTDYTYTGQQVVENVGLMYYGARWHDAQLGRFCQADTVVPQPGNPQDLNRFTYVRNNPLRYTDPTGHYTDEQIQQYLMDTYGDLWEAYSKAWCSDQYFMDMLHAAFNGSTMWNAYGNHGYFHGVQGPDGAERSDTFGFEDMFGREGGLEAFQGYGPYFLNPKAPTSDRQAGSWAWRTITDYTFQPIYYYTAGHPPAFAKLYREACYDTTRVTGFDPLARTGFPWVLTGVPTLVKVGIGVASQASPAFAASKAAVLVGAIPSPVTTAVFAAAAANYAAYGFQVDVRCASTTTRWGGESGPMTGRAATDERESSARAYRSLATQ